MESLLIRILIAIGVIWLVQTLLGAFEIKEPANKIIFIFAIILSIIWLVSGNLLIK